MGNGCLLWLIGLAIWDAQLAYYWRADARATQLGYSAAPFGWDAQVEYLGFYTGIGRYGLLH